MANLKVLVWQPLRSRIRRFWKNIEWFLGLALLILEIIRHLLDFLK